MDRPTIRPPSSMADAAPLHLDDSAADMQQHIRHRRPPIWTTRTPSPDDDQRPSIMPSSHSSLDSSTSVTPTSPVHPSNLPTGSRSLAGISLRAFLLGTVLGLCTLATLCLLTLPALLQLDTSSLTIFRLWRPAFFLAALALFHFLEFYVTAAHNPARADVAAFLLTTNGAAYNAAHTGALLEAVLTAVFLPSWQTWLANPPVIVAGLALVLAGQTVRYLAMATAATNFNHTVQTRRSAGHVLVSHGVYAWLRHPSYFGFFWWGVGTQLVLGNKLCLLAYAVILWNFFRHRIAKEERYLVTFFGADYEAYREKVGVGIPFIA